MKYILPRAISKMLNKFMHIRNTKGAGKLNLLLFFSIILTSTEPK